MLKDLKEGKIKLNHPKVKNFKFDFARHDNLFINLCANPPKVSELCDCGWDDDE